MADVTIVPADVRPLAGCITRRFTAGGTAGVGKPVALSANDTIVLADATDVTLSFAVGVLIAVYGGASAVEAASGDECDVVVFGPVCGYSTNMAYNTLFYVDDDAGVICTAAGTKTTILGLGLNGSTMLVNPSPRTLA